MMVKLLGTGDAYVVFAMMFAPVLPIKFLVYAALWLIFKGGIFALAGDIISYFDIISGIYVLFYAYGFSITLVSVIVAIYLGQKFMVSWL